MDLKPGTRLRSTESGTEVVVVRAPNRAVTVVCGGAPMVLLDRSVPPAPSAPSEHGVGSILGKRYSHEDTGLELLCTSPGSGPPSVDGEPLAIQSAKTLPSSD
jgi:hypothetical protein